MTSYGPCTFILMLFSAILVLQDTVSFSDYIRPICLNTETLSPGDVVFLSGWGNTEDGLKLPKSAVVLQNIQQNIEDDAKCSALLQLGDVGGISPSQICAGTNIRGRKTNLINTKIV